MKTNLNEWRDEVHKTAVEHGWWDNDVSFPEVVALCHSELSEALEEYRNGRPVAYADDYSDEGFGRITDLSKFKGRKPEGMAMEMADCLVRILDWCGEENIDIEQMVKIKSKYNKTRPYRHGGKVI